MNTQSTLDEYPKHSPILRFAIVTYELGESRAGTPLYIETLTHIFHGNSMEEIQSIIAAHRKTDKFFDGSFIGNFNGITLKNEIIGLI